MRNIPLRASGLVLASLLALLTGCSTTCPEVKTEVVEVSVPVVVPLKQELQKITPEPAKPTRACRDADGAPTICEGDMASWVERLRSWGLGLSGQLKEIVSLQPKAEKP